VPTREHLAAQERAAPQRHLDFPARRGVRGIRLRAKLGRGRELLDRSTLDDGRTSREARERTAQRPADQCGPRLRVGSEVVEPRAYGREGGRGKETLCEQRLGHDENVRLGQALVLEHLP
jgi:hypothetical protein